MMFGFVVCFALAGEIATEFGVEVTAPASDPVSEVSESDVEVSVSHVDTTDVVEEAVSYENVKREDVLRMWRRHRIQVYNLYRNDRAEFDRRVELANQVAELADQVQRESSTQETLARWYSDAAAAAKNGGGPPAIPDIDTNSFERPYAVAAQEELIRRESDDRTRREIERARENVDASSSWETVETAKQSLNPRDQLLNELSQSGTTLETLDQDEVDVRPEITASGGVLKSIGALFGAASQVSEAASAPTSSPELTTVEIGENTSSDDEGDTAADTDQTALAMPTMLPDSEPELTEPELTESATELSPNDSLVD